MSKFGSIEWIVWYGCYYRHCEVLCSAEIDESIRDSPFMKGLDFNKTGLHNLTLSVTYENAHQRVRGLGGY